MKLKQIFKELVFLKKKMFIYASFKNRHKKIFNNPTLNKTELSNEEKKEYLDYWKTKGFSVSLDTIKATKLISGNFDKRVVPEEIFSLYIEKQLTPIDVTFLENKNIYNKWFDNGIFPNDYFHKINDVYYDKNLIVISDISLFIDVTDFKFPIVFKPSCDTYGGQDVCFLNSKEELKEKIEGFTNIVVQEKIIQHNDINKIYDESINTIRVCLLRRPTNNEIVVLNSSLRMGRDGSLDNVKAGGIVNNISKEGVFNKFSVDIFGSKYYNHPNSGFIFEKMILPNYKDMIEVSINIASQIPHSNLFSLDMAYCSEGKWKCIEVNLSGQTIRFAQYAGNPFFGVYTDEVINNK